LEGLSLKGNINISDETLYSISHLQYLKELDLNGCRKITNSGIHSLFRLNLKRISLNGLNRLTNSIFDSINIQNLEVLDIGMTNIDCAQCLLKYDLSNIGSLSLTNTNITDEILEVLAKSRNLKFLSICLCPNITNIGLNYLKSTHSLDNLMLTLNPISSDAVLKLQTEYLIRSQNVDILIL